MAEIINPQASKNTPTHRFEFVKVSIVEKSGLECDRRECCLLIRVKGIGACLIGERNAHLVVLERCH